MSRLSREDYNVLPLALYGMAGGIWEYFIKKPIRHSIENWVESHLFDQEEFEQYIEEVSATILRKEPNTNE